MVVESANHQDDNDDKALPSAAQASEKAGLVGAQRFLLSAFLLIRVFMLALAVIVTASRWHHGYINLYVCILILAAFTVWTVFLGNSTWQAGAYEPPAHAIADIAASGAALVAVGVLCRNGEAATWTNWAFPVGLTTVIGAGIALPLAAASAASFALAAAFVAGTLPGISRGQVPPSNLIGDVLSFGAYVVFASVLARQLRDTATRLDAATAHAVATERKLAAEEARFAERNAHHRRLHDTVLQTLTLISRGALDAQLPAVRERCARDAELVRGLIRNSDSGTLADRLDALVAERISEGMVVHYRLACAAVVPADVVAAICSAVGEALTNVVKHSQTQEAWVTVLPGETTEQTIITVVDRGCGGVTERQQHGMDRSIRQPIEQHGGAVGVTSEAGEGTLVELRWPK